jgi:tetratricopeptide (TPR) repeat protein
MNRILNRTLVFCCVLAAAIRAQAPQSPAAPAAEVPGVTAAPSSLETADRAAFTEAMQRRDYTRAETILVEAINRETARDPKSKRAAQLLGVAGGVFFLNGEWLNAAISFKKAEAIAPLVERDRFTLAMAYIRLDRRDWAKEALAKLAAEFPRNALYLYWLGRIEYDAQQYRTAIARFEQVIALDPQMMRAHDNLGLCYDYLGQYDEAVKHYNRAIELNRNQPRPSPWPHLNLGVTLLAQNKLSEAESSLREALRADSRLPQAHYHLGLALDKLGKPDEAIGALEQAAALDATYPDPHYTLGLLYQKQGDKVKAQEAFVRFQRLKSAK